MMSVPRHDRFAHSTLVGLIFLFFILSPDTHAAGGDQSDLPVKTNLEVFQTELSSLAAELVQKSGDGLGRNVVVNVRSQDTSWVARNTIVEALTKLNYSVSLPSSGGERKGATIDLGIVEMKVRYGDVFREGFLGKRRTERTISTTVSANVRNVQNEILFVGAASRAHKDTVDVSDVAQLENSSISFTHGEPPGTDFFENVLEPAIIIGASAVVVYLFFTVRS
ncbi:MAG: hypothetical protein WBW16_00410 [Bacteroidota bacterium]